MAKKYEIVACVGEPWDYTYEKVDEVTNWKEARRLEKLGANIYLNGQRILFVDHKSVRKAFGVIRSITLCRRCAYWDDGFLDIDDVIDLEEAHKVLDQNGFKITDAIIEKWANRGEHVHDPLTLPRKDRPRYLFKAVETDELPF